MAIEQPQRDRRHRTDSDRIRFTAGGQVPTIVAGEGCELITADGRRILDAAGGAVVNNVGHGRRQVATAVAAAMANLDYVLPIWPTPTRLELIDYLVERWLPSGFERVFFAGGGSEANDSAMRLARSYHLARGESQRYKVIGRVPSYHGSTLATLSIGGHMARRDGYDPLLQEHPKVPWDNAGALAAAIEASDPATVSAFIAEPIIGASGAALIAPLDYWAAVSEVCREYGVLMIADEVMTGFGRTGQRWGHDHDHWKPDVIVAAKGISGGYLPLSMVSATNEVVDAVAAADRNVMYFTYSGHDASCAAALTVLGIVESEGLIDRARVQGAKLLSALEDAVGSHPSVVEVRGRGLMLGVELEGLASLPVVEQALERDVWIYPAGSGPSVNDGLLFAPPLIVTDQQIGRIAEVTAASIDAVRAQKLG
ncbi:MAG: aspartate aminotransferase family protein [Acidimicrobiales bacterium]